MNETRAAAFGWTDPVGIDKQLTDEERMACDTADLFAQEKLQPQVNVARGGPQIAGMAPP